jgi:hypothetical protein
MVFVKDTVLFHASELVLTESVRLDVVDLAMEVDVDAPAIFVVDPKVKVDARGTGWAVVVAEHEGVNVYETA